MKFQCVIKLVTSPINQPLQGFCVTLVTCKTLTMCELDFELNPPVHTQKHTPSDEREKLTARVPRASDDRPVCGSALRAGKVPAHALARPKS